MNATRCDRSLRGVATLILGGAIAIGVMADTATAQTVVGPHEHPDLGKAEIYALVIGVTNYGKNADTASKAAKGAAEFAKVVQQTYGDAALRYLLLDEKAKLENVNKALREIKKLPPGSLVIIYFSGHGVRENYSAGSELYLRLYGSTPTDFDGTAIEARYLWESLASTNFTNGMIFLDCCHAGSDDKNIVPESRLLGANVRSFMMCACSKDEMATGDIFTEALLEVWRKTRENKANCTNLDDFRKKVLALVRQRSTGFMTPGFPAPSKLQTRCITRMDQPSSLLYFTFPRGCRAGVDIYLNNELVEPGFLYSKDFFYSCQVDLNEPLIIEVRGTENKVLAGPVKILPKDKLPQRIFEFPVLVPDDYAMADHGRASRESQGYEKLAQTVEAFGADPGKFYELALTKHSEAAPGEDVAWLGRKAYVYNKGDVLLAYAYGSEPLSDQAKQRYVRQPLEALRDAARLEGLGAFGPAAALCKEVSQRVARGDAEVGQDLLIRAAGNLKIAGSAGADALLAEVEKSRPSGLQSDAIRLVKLASPRELAGVWRDIPSSRIGWVASRFATSEESRQKVLRALASVGLDRESVSNNLASLTLPATMSPWELLLTQQGGAGPDSSHLWTIRMGDTYPQIDLTGSNAVTPALEYIATFGGDDKVEIKAPSRSSAQSVALFKPGYWTALADRSAFVSSKTTRACSGFFPVESKTTFDGPDGFKIVAEDFPTAVGYTSTKPGFTSRYENGFNYITELKQGAPVLKDFKVTDPVDKSFGQWTNMFTSEEAKTKYNGLSEFPKLLPNR